MWDRYVLSHPHATLYHLYGWRQVIHEAYGHAAYYLMAVDDQNGSVLAGNCTPPAAGIGKEIIGTIKGILPLFHLKHFLFGNTLFSIPFFDQGGILADDEQTEQLLLDAALELAVKIKAKNIELRQTFPLFPQPIHERGTTMPRSGGPYRMYCLEPPKYRMLLRSLPDSAGSLLQSFKSKLRSQIHRPLKEGFSSRTGGLEMLDDFYHVFLVRMRELGSPVHSKRLIGTVLDVFPGASRIIAVYRDSVPVAGSLVIGMKDRLGNPWASSLRSFSRFSPNMLLYWSMIEYACDHGYRELDFGRSSKDEGTYVFKRQWGAEAIPLHWHFVTSDQSRGDPGAIMKSRYRNFSSLWTKLPVLLTRLIGPAVRKHIGL